MIPAGVLAGRLSLVAKERKSVDFPVEIPAANFCYFFFKPFSYCRDSESLSHRHFSLLLNAPETA